MHILLLNDRLYPDFIGGVERRNFDLAIALAERGHDVTLIGFGLPPDPAPCGVRFVSLGPLGTVYSREGKRSTRQAFRFAWRVLRLDVSGYDIVEASNIPYIHLIPLAVRCAIGRKPVLITWYEFWGPYWTKYLGRWRAPIYRIVEWLTAQLGARVVATSRLTADRLAASRLRRGRVRVLPCGIHLREIEGAIAGTSNASGRTLIYAGRLVRHKQVDLLIEAVARLPGVNLVIFGDGPEMTALRQLAATRGVEHRCSFRGHVASEATVWRSIRQADIAVQPSAREGFGIFPLESMAIGVPVVYCDNLDNAVREIVRDGIEGVSAACDADSLAHAIGDLLDNPERRHALAVAAGARAKQFDWRIVAAGFERELVALVGREEPSDALPVAVPPPQARTSRVLD